MINFENPPRRINQDLLERFWCWKGYPGRLKRISAGSIFWKVKTDVGIVIYSDKSPLLKHLGKYPKEVKSNFDDMVFREHLRS